MRGIDYHLAIRENGGFCKMKKHIGVFCGAFFGFHMAQYISVSLGYQPQKWQLEGVIGAILGMIFVDVLMKFRSAAR